jgi:hypothetical protein
MGCLAGGFGVLAVFVPDNCSIADEPNTEAPVMEAELNKAIFFNQFRLDLEDSFELISVVLVIVLYFLV